MQRKTRRSADKRLREQRLIAEMIALYCRKRHTPGSPACGEGAVQAQPALCPACAELVAYAQRRSERCPRMAEKTFCSACPHPCYAPAMRERVREVMRYAGPRMLMRHPVMTIRHGMETARQKWAQRAAA